MDPNEPSRDVKIGKRLKKELTQQLTEFLSHKPSRDVKIGKGLKKKELTQQLTEFLSLN